MEMEASDMNAQVKSLWRLPFKGKTLYEFAKGLRPRIDRVIMRGSLVPDRAVMDKKDFPWIAMLEENWETIRDEAVRIATSEIPPLGDISPDHGRIAADRRWKSFFLQGYGYRREENCARAPRTAALISQIPDLVTAFFSVLEAGCHIPRHSGPTKGLLISHLALRAPKDRANCHMDVWGGGERHVLNWIDGQAFIFDDTYDHEVWNDTGEDRYILLIQVRRPCRGIARAMLDFFLWGIRLSPFVQDVKRRLDAQLPGRQPPGAVPTAH